MFYFLLIFNLLGLIFVINYLQFMENKYLFILLLILFFLIRFLFKINRNNSKESISIINIDSAQFIELESNSIESEDSIETVFEHPIKKQNSYLNPIDDFGTLKKGVVLDHQIYEYEVADNYNYNFTIIYFDKNQSP